MPPLDLPATVLSTPFGQSIRPMIDRMYGRRSTGVYPTPAPTPPSVPQSAGINPQLASSLLQSVAAQAAGSNIASPTTAASLTSSLHISTNLASLEHIASTHKATAVLLTTGTSKSLEQIFEQFAKDHGLMVGCAFVKMDTQVGSAKDVLAKYPLFGLPGMLLFRREQCVSRNLKLPRLQLSNASTRSPTHRYRQVIFFFRL